MNLRIILVRSFLTCSLCVLISKIAFAQELVSAAVRAGGSSEVPTYYSSTNCKASWGGVTNAFYFVLIPPYNLPVFRRCYIAHAKFSIGGEIVLDQSFPETTVNSQDGGVNFDSTHFSDGTAATLHIELIDNIGNVGVADSPSGSAVVYNKGYVIGNDVMSIGSLNHGSSAVSRIAPKISGINHTISPSGTSAQLAVVMPAFLANVPLYTVFYAYTHGTGADVGDSMSSISPPVITHYFSSGELYYLMQSVGNYKSINHIPLYNFVFCDSCLTFTDDAMARAFGVSDSVDRVGVGWDQLVDDSLHNADWSNALFEQLCAGRNFGLAAMWANNIIGMVHASNPDRDVSPTAYGDAFFRLTGVYGLIEPFGTTWFY